MKLWFWLVKQKIHPLTTHKQCLTENFRVCYSTENRENDKWYSAVKQFGLTILAFMREQPQLNFISFSAHISASLTRATQHAMTGHNQRNLRDANARERMSANGFHI